MLQELSIANFAIIDRSRIRFEDGLNAVTGETGAGKSILLDALGAVLGQRVSSDLVRTGEKDAHIEALFSLPLDGGEGILAALADAGVEHDPQEPLIFAREIQANGRSSARINGRMVTAALMSEIGGWLVDIHGQSDHLSLLRGSEQRRIIDRFGHLEERHHALAEGVSEWRRLREALANLDKGAREREQRRDLLRFQVDEIDEAALQPDEDDQLARERDVLQNADALRQSALSTLEHLAGDSQDVNVLSLLRLVSHEMQTVVDVDREASGLGERTTELLVLAEDLVRDVRDYSDAIEGDAGRLEDVEERLALIQSLRRKYGPTIEDILAFRADASAELASLSGDEYDQEALTTRLRSVEADLATQVSELSTARSRVATDLAERITGAIAELRMGSAVVEIELAQQEDSEGLALPDGRRVHVDESGVDRITFLMAPSAGEALRPLGRIASGGETARVMLAIKSILSDVDETPTLVFDEIDVGVGGRSGQLVGEKLWSLAGHHQVIVISHLAQIAAFADKHFRIAKQERNDRIVSEVEELDPLTREEELAAMLDGIPATPESLANARAMLQRVHDLRERRG